MTNNDVLESVSATCFLVSPSPRLPITGGLPPEVRCPSKRRNPQSFRASSACHRCYCGFSAPSTVSMFATHR